MESLSSTGPLVYQIVWNHALVQMMNQQLSTPARLDWARIVGQLTVTADMVQKLFPRLKTLTKRMERPTHLSINDKEGPVILALVVVVVLGNLHPDVASMTFSEAPSWLEWADPWLCIVQAGEGEARHTLHGIDWMLKTAIRFLDTQYEALMWMERVAAEDAHKLLSLADLLYVTGKTVQRLPSPVQERLVVSTLLTGNDPETVLPAWHLLLYLPNEFWAHHAALRHLLGQQAEELYTPEAFSLWWDEPWGRAYECIPVIGDDLPYLGEDWFHRRAWVSMDVQRSLCAHILASMDVPAEMGTAYGDVFFPRAYVDSRAWQEEITPQQRQQLVASIRTSPLNVHSLGPILISVPLPELEPVYAQHMLNHAPWAFMAMNGLPTPTVHKYRHQMMEAARQFQHGRLRAAALLYLNHLVHSTQPEDVADYDSLISSISATDVALVQWLPRLHPRVLQDLPLCDLFLWCAPGEELVFGHLPVHVLEGLVVSLCAQPNTLIPFLCQLPTVVLNALVAPWPTVFGVVLQQAPETLAATFFLHVAMRLERSTDSRHWEEWRVRAAEWRAHTQSLGLAVWQRLCAEQ